MGHGEDNHANTFRYLEYLFPTQISFQNLSLRNLFDCLTDSLRASSGSSSHFDPTTERESGQRGLGVLLGGVGVQEDAGAGTTKNETSTFSVTARLRMQLVQ